ncbi:MAG: hypothetical protein KAJ51_13250 [Thermoplasmata archaeon]|nr:hypothetical protein [Thermoplasmata archaeon]
MHLILKKFLSIVLTISFVLVGYPIALILVPEHPSLKAAIITVDDSGGAMYTTIQAGIDNAINGDIIYVRAGTYNENVKVDKSLTLIGNGMSNTTIIGGASDTTLKIEANYVNLTGFRICQGTKSGRIGLWMQNNKNLTIDNCKILGGDGYDSTFMDGGYGGTGIWITNGINITITNSTIWGGNGGNTTSGDGGDGGRATNIQNTKFLNITNNSISGGQGGTGSSWIGYDGHAIALDSTSGIIEHNNLSNSGSGIVYWWSSSVIANNNTLYGNDAGMSFHYGSSPLIESNYFIKNIRGVNAYNDGSGGVSSPILINNTITASASYDFRLAGTHSRPFVVNTTFNSTNIYFEYTSSLTVQWFLEVYVRNTNNQSIPDVWVNITDANINSIANRVTNTKGFAGYIICTSYIQTETSIDYSMNDHNISVSLGTQNVYRDVNMSSNRIENFTLIAANIPPSIDTSDINYALEDQLYDAKYIATDRNNDLIIWDESDNATWLHWGVGNYTLYGTPGNDDVGFYWVRINITDGFNGYDEHNFSLEVININDAPSITTIDINTTLEDEKYEVIYNAIEIDKGDVLTWTYDSNATWLNWGPENHTLFGTPHNNDVGLYWVRINVSDLNNSSDERNFNLTIININDPPEIITEDKLIINVSELYEVDYNATDVDSPLSDQTWSLITNATWLNINTITGILTGTPSMFDVGWYNVKVNVDDGDGGQDWHEFILTVIILKDPVIENESPIIITKDVITALVGKLYEVDYDATDDHTPVESLIWSFNSNASWLSFNKITRALSGNPTLSHVGWYWVNLTVSDDEDGSDSHNFTLTVYNEPNQPPFITTEDQLNAVVDVLYSVDYDAIDDRTPIDYLYWSLKTNASWLTINTNTGVLSGKPSASDVGWYIVNVSVFDGENGWDFHNFILSVTTEPIKENNAPELSNPTITPSEGDVETEFTFTVHYYDEDGNAPLLIKIVIDGNGFTMTLNTGENAYDGVYEYKTKLSEGNHTYYFTVSDGIDPATTNTYSTPYINKVTDVDGGKPSKSDDEDNSMLYASIGIIVIIIIIVLILLFLLVLKKKPQEEEGIEETPPEAPEQPPILAIPPVQPPQEVPTPVITITPQVVPQVVPPLQLPPLPQVEEPQEPVVPTIKQPTIKPEENIEE